MKIWITGIAGFLGSHLADALILEGHEVCGNDNLICGDIDNIPQGVCWKGTDCCDFIGMKKNFDKFKPEVLVHCAATAQEGLSNFSPSFITRNIYEASVATFSAAIASGVKRIVYMSSMARYGEGALDFELSQGYPNPANNQYRVKRLGPPFKEDYPTAPIDPYGIAKVAAEDTLKVLCKTHNVKWSIAVPHNIIGVRQRYIDPFRNVASIMINRSKQGKPIIVYGDGLQRRCFSPVKDCIQSIVKMVLGQADGEIVNIGPDKGEITIKELAERIGSLTDSKLAPQHMPDRPNEVKLAYTNSDKARQLLGYKEAQSLDACLMEMVADIEAKPFVYDFPIEIVEGCPKTWTEKLI